MPEYELSPRPERYLRLLDQGKQAFQESSIGAKLKATRIFGILERHPLNAAKSSTRSLVASQDESTHDLTVGVSSLDRTSSDVGKPTTSQSGFSRDKSNQIATLTELIGQTHRLFIESAVERDPVKKEAARLALNRAIAAGNELRRTQAVTAGVITPLTGALIQTLQVPAPESPNQFRQPGSPAMPHHGLGKLRIYRQIPNGKLTAAIGEQVRAIGGDQGTKDLALAVAYLVPDNVIRLQTPDISSYQELSAYIASLAHTVEQYQSGRFLVPTPEQLGGTRGAEQDHYILAQTKALLAHYLLEELREPNNIEHAIQLLYGRLGKNVRHTAEYITPGYNPVIRGGRPTQRRINRIPGLQDSYKRVGEIINGEMDGLHGVMLVARFSTRLIEDLGLPCIDYIGELRIAEVVRNIAYRIKAYRSNRGLSTVGGFTTNQQDEYLLRNIFDSISGRLDEQTFDCNAFFGALASVDDGSEVIKDISRAADDEQRAILSVMLSETHHFRNLRRALDRMD